MDRLHIVREPLPRLGAGAKRAGTIWRHTALWTLRVLCVPAWAAAVFFLVLLSLTAQVAVQRFGLSDGQGGSDLPRWLLTLVEFDLSCCSALIGLLTASFLAWSGTRSSIQLPRVEKKEFWDHAYPYRLFPPLLFSLCLQLGLIGTLFSFTAAAYSQLAEPETPLPPAASEPLALVEPLPVPGQTGSRSQGSYKVFLLLCAALNSTLVGCVAAYLVIQPLERVQAWALGQPLVPRVDPLDSVRSLGPVFLELGGQLAQTAARLDGLNAMFGRVEQMGEQFAAVCDRLPEMDRQLEALGAQFSSLQPRLEDAASAFAGASASALKTAASMTSAAAQLRANEETLRWLPSAFKPVLDRFERVAESAATAQRDLAATARGVEKPAGLMAEVSSQLLGFCNGILPVLQGLDRTQSQGVAAFTNLESKLALLLGRIEAANAAVGRQAEARLVALEKKDEATEAALLGSSAALEIAMKKMDEIAKALDRRQRAVARVAAGVESLLARVERLEQPQESRAQARSSWAPWHWFLRRRSNGSPHSPLAPPSEDPS